MKIGIVRNWWILAARGLLAIAFGLYVVLMPGTALATMILAFGVAVLVAGILAIVAAMRVHDQHEWSFVIAVEGVICVLFGLLCRFRRSDSKRQFRPPASSFCHKHLHLRSEVR